MAFKTNALLHLLTDKCKERFWGKVGTGAPNECWPWKEARHPLGYGVFSMRDDEGTWCVRRAHRVAYVLAYGEPEPGRVVRHSCDNTSCCNPDHLASGTQAENMRDMHTRGRAALGESHGTAKLTEDNVRKIRAMAANGMQNKILAMQFGVSAATISRTVKHVNWSGV